MKTVALVGLAETTREAIQNSKADEIWTINWAYNYKFIPRIDRLFEMHPIWLFYYNNLPEWEKPRKHWEWLFQPREYPVYMLADIPKIPKCIRYPIEDVTKNLFGDRFLKGENPTDFYSSSFDYLMALAIHEAFDVIEVYGFEMGSDTEYRYQREGAAFFSGQAIARGIKVKLQQNSILLKGRKYGYSGGQVIYRQDIERIKYNFSVQKRNALARLQHKEGEIHSLIEQKASENKIEEIQNLINSFREEALIASGAEQCAIYLLQYIDLEEPEFNLENPLLVIPLEAPDPEDRHQDWFI